jgi:transposase-like protein
MSIFSAPRFTNEEAAREHLESIRWPHGSVCPHCGGTERNSALKGESHRAGLYFCGDCRTQFTVTVGTLFERSKVPLHKWLLAVHLLCSSKKGMSSHQLHRTLEVTYKTAWFMTHRIREAMTSEGGLLGGGGGTVEADETYWGSCKRSKAGKERAALGRRGFDHKQKIIALVERDGSVRGFHVASVNGATLKQVLRENIAKDANLMTDENHMYRKVGREFASHQTVNHSAGEYSRGNVTTNTIEGYFSILKRGLIGTYHHVSPKHLGRYVQEFDFRYNNRKVSDTERAANALRGISGKRLTYRRTQESQAA